MNEIDVQELLTWLVRTVSEYGLKVLGAIAIFVVGRMVAKWVRSFLCRGLEGKGVDATLIPFLSGVAYWLLLAGVVIAALDLLGAQPTGFVAVLGAAGLAVGLAMQGTLSNFAAGVMLLLFRPFRTGDFVEVGGTKGSVQTISLFTTTLHSPDNVKIIVPNGDVFGQTIHNYSANDTRRIDLVVGVDYGDDLALAKSTLTTILGETEGVLSDPAPIVEVLELGASSVDFAVRPWVRNEDYWPVRFELTRKIKEDVEAAGLSFPFPQRDLHVYQQS